MSIKEAVEMVVEGMGFTGKVEVSFDQRSTCAKTFTPVENFRETVVQF